jgi:predicted O-linked N-acetylglucosamine transferase (SPINDLY family)
MGVPVVTLVGQVHASRVGLSLMSNAGLPELAATTEEEFVAIALGLYHDRERLAMLRTTLRDRMARSPICDGPGFARKLEAIYRSAWAQWCATGSARGSVRT